MPPCEYLTTDDQDLLRRGVIVKAEGTCIAYYIRNPGLPERRYVLMSEEIVQLLESFVTSHGHTLEWRELSHGQETGSEL